ncbi:polyhydroxyalkanoate depolymerase [Polynucleobacter sp. Latsch14-2]|jgi:polyhydroxyalkanoate depolymerase|uniref:polyhydroxyalkanoate depolymerase n=1 Tax=Polynucleobacter sp. Latsch14-2 TaxID=2576920 RepID=UPI001C0E443D|nr:polyhydroxyalkanoate depolymerase [Polynucleobacter sp. Latsch14-2]
MMYRAYQTFANLHDPVRLFASASERVSKNWFGNFSLNPMQRLAAHYEQISLLGFTHARPDFKINSIIDSLGAEQKVREELVYSTHFCNLVRFKKEDIEGQPKILLVAPMSGHFATLLTGTIKTLLKDHEVYVTDWLNIRDIPLSCGDFDFDSYVEHIINFLKVIGPETHLMGVCQPTVACLAATAIMSEDKSSYAPASMTLMAGPLDVRMSPTKVNELATSKPISWFEEKLIGVIPSQFNGTGRRVYPGFLQLMAFMSMNPDRHAESFRKLYEYRVNGETEKADAIHEFYEEYFAIMDLSAPFYLETIRKVFQDCDLPNGKLTYQGRLVNPKLIKKTFLLTVEGERDDICGIGQTLAAQDLCSGLAGYRKSHHLQAGVGHYGVFNGKRWEAQIYPVVRNHIQSAL